MERPQSSLNAKLGSIAVPILFKDCNPIFCFKLINKDVRDWSLEHYCTNAEEFQKHCPYCFNKTQCTAPIPTKSLTQMPLDDE